MLQFGKKINEAKLAAYRAVIRSFSIHVMKKIDNFQAIRQRKVSLRFGDIFFSIFFGSVASTESLDT